MKIMKKLYETPMVIIGDMETEEMIATSNLSNVLNDEGGEATFSDKAATGDALSRGSIWADEE